ncbi:MAG: ATP-binding protein, partial [Thermodesulfobacteriota bacterium]|nr:ATP-binding protein [Thermodesulfobacteriota bacterium]
EKSRMRTIIYCMADGVLVINLKGEMVLYNPAASRILGIANDPATGKNLRELIANRAVVELLESQLTSINSNLTSFYKEVILPDKAVIRVHIAPVKGDSGEPLGLVTVFQDISQLKALEQMKSDFVAMVCHQLRSPLSTIGQQLTAILSQVVEKEKEKEMLMRAKERIKDLISLINNLLDISKIEAGLVIQHKESLEISEIIKKVIDLIRPLAEKKNISLEVFIDPKLPSIDGDRNCIEEVFVNLLSNAMNYTPERGRVIMEAKKEGECLRINVADTGIGISKEDIPKIFDKFYRIRTDQTKKIGGTGLGLPIVKGIIDAHLGSIHVESEPGKGTVFTVFLPESIKPNP